MNRFRIQGVAMARKDFRRDLIFLVIGAVLTLLVQIVVQSRDKKADAEREAAAAARNAENMKRVELNQFYAAYSDLGDLPRNAGAFLDGEKAGSADSVRVMIRHFSRLSAMTRTGQFHRRDVANLYGGVLRRWGERLSQISSRQSLAASFSDSELRNMQILGPALTEIWRAADVQTLPEGDDALEASVAMDSADATEISETRSAH